jgi:RNA polymerase sigma-70 factor (ECF subfamily)
MSSKHVPVNDSMMTLARAGDERAFRALTDPYRRELQLHCYRMLGSSHDAEDALQETLVAAWRGLRAFEQRTSVRAWLYRIATNRCLNMLRERFRRPRSAGRLPFDRPAPTRMGETTWLEPYPDELLEGLPDAAPGPDARYEMREAVGLAFISALQRLPARQRTVLVLRDVLGFRAAEVADMLSTTDATVNSALQRARSALDARLGPARARAPAPRSQRERELAQSFADAFEQGDTDRVVSLLTEDASLTMPPEPFEYQGRETIASFLRHVNVLRVPGRVTRLVPTRANGQPAFGHYIKEPDEATARGTGLIVLTVEGDRIAAITRFGHADLLPRFGLPVALPPSVISQRFLREP